MQPAPSDTHEMSIHRHCMQQLLHHAITTLSHEQDCCQGLLAGRNMIEKRLAVTKSDFPDQRCIENFFNTCSMAGIYISADSSSKIDPARIHSLVELAERYYGHVPGCYLLLETGHKGRVDAQLFADAEFTLPMPLNLKEDGSLYRATVNR